MIDVSDRRSLRHPGPDRTLTTRRLQELIPSTPNTTPNRLSERPLAQEKDGITQSTGTGVSEVNAAAVTVPFSLAALNCALRTKIEGQSSEPRLPPRHKHRRFPVLFA
ncbi:hypothetical protein PsYK624_158050 [Phanerochaete sordida]|uniref:Uncharacterized protein n=1 Tax=Phanerochaete sordida TaxID=48140 RepID=A0A9P3LLB9_9APHY|nr:hypothetical protein PsYK624_158050 [Phanerochaete sordida]